MTKTRKEKTEIRLKPGAEGSKKHSDLLKRRLVLVKKALVKSSKELLKQKQECQKAQIALRTSQRSLKNTQKIAQMGNWELEFGTGKLSWSDETFRIFGMNKSKFQPNYREFLKLVHPDDRENVNKAYIASLSKDSTGYEIEHRIILKNDGRTRYLYEKCEHLRNRTGKIVRSIGTVQDISDRRWAEQQLWENQELFHALINSSPDAIYIKDFHSRWLMANPAVLKILGKSLRETLGKTDMEICSDPKIGRQFIENDLLVIKAGKPITTEEVYESKGERRIFLSTKAPWKDEQGRVIGLIGISHDITQRKKIEKDIFHSRQRMQALLEALPVGVSFSEDASCRKITGNAECLKQFETSAEENVSKSSSNESDIGRKVRYFKEGKELKDTDLPLQKAVNENRMIEGMDLEILLPSGKRWLALVSAAPVRDQNGNVLGGVAVTLDVTEQQKIDSELKSTSERFMLLAHTASALLQTNEIQPVINDLCHRVMEYLDCQVFFNFLLDEEKKRLRVNAFAGVPEENAHQIQELELGVAVCGCVAQLGKPIIAEHIPSSHDLRTELVRSLGVKAYACHPLFGSEGKVIGTLSFGSRTREIFSEKDISLMRVVSDQVATAVMRIQNEKAMQKSHDELEVRVKERTLQLLEAQEQVERAKRLADIGVLAATVAHELRNPLAAISMAAQNIKRKAANPELEKHFANIEKKVGESDQIINNLLFYSRLKPPHFETVNLTGILEECCEALDKQNKKELSLVKNFGEKQFIQADPFQIKEVFNNILDNSYDVIPPEKGMIKVASQTVGEFAEITIEDNGPGIPPEIRERIFDPFFTTKAKGTGLGLSVCKQIISMHHGEVGLRDSSGACVFVRFPLERKPAMLESETQPVDLVK